MVAFDPHAADGHSTHSNNSGNGAGAEQEAPFGRDSGEPPRPLEWLADIQPSEECWVVKQMLPASGLASIYGPSGSGKSFVALDWSLRIACGLEVLSARTRRVGVAFIAAEAPGAVRKRICAWRRENGDDGAFALYDGAFNLFDLEGVARLIDILREAHAEFREIGKPLGMVVVDTLAAAAAGGDEGPADMGAAVASLQHIGRELGVLVVVVHHVGKDASRGARGHSSFYASIDVAFELTHDEDTGLRTLRLRKERDEAGDRSWGFRLHRVELGDDSDGDPITSCVVNYVDAPPPHAPKRSSPLKPDARIVLDALKAVLSTHGERPPPLTPCSAGTYAAPYAMVRERAYNLGLIEGSEPPSTKRNILSRALKDLRHRKLIHVWQPGDGGWVWLTNEGNEGGASQ